MAAARYKEGTQRNMWLASGSSRDEEGGETPGVNFLPALNPGDLRGRFWKESGIAGWGKTWQQKFDDDGSLRDILAAAVVGQNFSVPTRTLSLFFPYLYPGRRL